MLTERAIHWNFTDQVKRDGQSSRVAFGYIWRNLKTAYSSVFAVVFGNEMVDSAEPFNRVHRG